MTSSELRPPLAASLSAGWPQSGWTPGARLYSCGCATAKHHQGKPLQACGSGWAPAAKQCWTPASATAWCTSDRRSTTSAATGLGGASLIYVGACRSAGRCMPHSAASDCNPAACRKVFCDNYLVRPGPQFTPRISMVFPCLGACTANPRRCCSRFLCMCRTADIMCPLRTRLWREGWT